MPTAVNVASSHDGVPSGYDSADPRKVTMKCECNGEWNTLTNDLVSLRQGLIKSSKNQVNEPCTLLLAGETGVGKSSFLEFIANVLAGNDIEHYNLNILDRTNEQDDSNSQSQTKEARLYEFKSNNGRVIRILDMPGLADTHDIQQDELNQKRIMTQIKKHIDSVTAVLVLANGTVPRVSVGVDYALSTLPTILPKNRAISIAFIFTNVLSSLHWNFSGDTIPDSLKDAPQFPLNNPIALQRKYLKFQENPNMKHRRPEMLRAVKAAEKDALEMLVDLFDWLDGLTPSC